MWKGWRKFDKNVFQPVNCQPIRYKSEIIFPTVFVFWHNVFQLVCVSSDIKLDSVRQEIMKTCLEIFQRFDILVNFENFILLNCPSSCITIGKRKIRKRFEAVFDLLVLQFLFEKAPMCSDVNDIEKATAYLASYISSFVTSQLLNVDGWFGFERNVCKCFSPFKEKIN